VISYAIGGSGGGNQTSSTTGVIVDGTLFLIFTFVTVINKNTVITEKVPAGETGVRVNASENEPRYLIENDNTKKVRCASLSTRHSLSTPVHTSLYFVFRFLHLYSKMASLHLLIQSIQETAYKADNIIGKVGDKR
jgi:hypothetical protein